MNLVVHASNELHQALLQEAREEGVTLNVLCLVKLAMLLGRRTAIKPPKSSDKGN